MSSSNFHDATGGTAGSNSATVGYDLVTGRGSPYANLVVSSLQSAITSSSGSTSSSGTTSGGGGLHKGNPKNSPKAEFLQIAAAHSLAANNLLSSGNASPSLLFNPSGDSHDLWHSNHLYVGDVRVA
jgi:hypothetical protein